VPDSQTPAVTGIEARPSVSGSEIFIHLWSGDEHGNKLIAVSWKTRNGLVYMIADLITANDGKLAGEVRDALVAQFSSPVKAITAARRIQGCVTAFADAKLGSRAAVGIAIYSQAGSFPATLGASTTVPANLLNYTQPGSITLSEGTALQVGRFPGLALRRVSPRDSDTTATGDQPWELLWAPMRSSARSVERIDRSATATTADVMGATAMGAELEAPLSLPSEESVGRDLVLPADSYHGTGGAPGRGEAARPSGPTLEIARDAYAAKIPPGDADSEESPPSETSHWFWPLTVATALALVLICSILIFQPKVPFRLHPAEHTENPEKPEGGTNPDQPPTAQRQSGSDETQSENPSIANPTEPQLATPPGNGAEPKSPPGEGEAKNPPEPKAPPSSVDGFSRSEIPLLLRKAEEDAGSGNYAAARREYKIVLRLDPGNAAAKQGIHRLELSAGESHD
jgi:hypothetical protein